MKLIIFLLFLVYTEAHQFQKQRDYDLQTKQDQCRQDRCDNYCPSKQCEPCNFNNPKCLSDVVLYGIVCDCPIGTIKIFTQDGFFVCTTGGFVCNGTFPYCCNPGFHMDPVTRRCVLNPPPCIPCRNGINGNCTGLCINGNCTGLCINGTNGINGTCTEPCTNGTNGTNGVNGTDGVNGTSCFQSIFNFSLECPNGGINITCDNGSSFICTPSNGTCDCNSTITMQTINWDDTDILVGTTVNITGVVISLYNLNEYVSPALISTNGGVYYFNYFFELESGGSSLTNRFALQRNGVDIPGTILVNIPNNLLEGGSRFMGVIVNMNPGDEVTYSVQNSSGGTIIFRRGVFIVTKLA